MRRMEDREHDDANTYAHTDVGHIKHRERMVVVMNMNEVHHKPPDDSVGDVAARAGQNANKPNAEPAVATGIEDEECDQYKAGEHTQREDDIKTRGGWDPTHQVKGNIVVFDVSKIEVAVDFHGSFLFEMVHRHPFG